MDSSNSTRKHGGLIPALAAAACLAVSGCSAPASSASVPSGGAGGAPHSAAQPVSGLLVEKLPSSMNTEVDAIDPASGASRTVVSFTSPDASVFIDPGIVGSTFGSSPMRRAMFSPDFQRVVAVKKGSDGNHVGWLDTAGKFTDVTGTGSSSGFSTATADDTPMFGTDGTFYFARREASGGTEKQPTIMKVPAGSTGPAAAVKALTYNEGVGYFVNPDGTLVGVPAMGGTFQVNGAGVGGYVVQDWLSTTDYVAIDNSHTGIYRVKGKPQAQADLMDSPTSGTALLPATNRNVYDAVVSPDKSQVAFLSKAPNSSDIQLYTVSSAGGGTPKQVPTSAVADKTELIGWK